MPGFAIEVAELVKKYGELTAVAGISFSVAKGELFALLGPNGAGKTTTISILCTLLRPTSGRAAVFGKDVVAEARQVKRHIGVSPQETVLSPRLNCWENLEVIASAHGLDRCTFRQRAGELLERVGLAERSREPVSRFSGGMKRRLNLIMALVHDPDVIFLDEPTLGLDPQSRRAIWEYIAELKGKKTILLTTHYLEEADSLSDRIGIIDEGRIVALGTPEELKKQVGEKVAVVEVDKVPAALAEELKTRFDKVYFEEKAVKIDGSAVSLPEVVQLFAAHQVEVRGFFWEEPSLDEVFLHLTGKELRE